MWGAVEAEPPPEPLASDASLECGRRLPADDHRSRPRPGSFDTAFWLAFPKSRASRVLPAPPPRAESSTSGQKSGELGEAPSDRWTGSAGQHRRWQEPAFTRMHRSGQLFELGSSPGRGSPSVQFFLGASQEGDL